MFIFFLMLITTSVLRLQNKEINFYVVLYEKKFYLSYIVTCSTVNQTESELIY